MNSDFDSFDAPDGLRTASDADRKADLMPAAGGLVGDARLLAQMVRAHVAGRFHVSAWAILTAVGALGYFLLLPDGIPDVIPLAGYADDAAVLGAATSVLRGEIDRFRRSPDGQV